MTNYAQGTGAGATGPGDGRTNPMRVRRNSLDMQDREALCFVICKCNAMPSIGVTGQKLKQQCVSGRLKTADAIGDHQSPYKAEINYDMSRDPPSPIMDSQVITKAHDYLPGWIQKYWPGGLDGYVPGVGNIRRPDVVIVNDPSSPPTQDNLKSVVEIKFPPDQFDPKQQEAYERIAGNPSKFSTMGPSDCGCSDEQPNQDESTQSAASALRKLIGQGLKGGLGGPMSPRIPFPLP